MASVGSITINLKADLAQFTQPFSAASKAVQHFASGVTSLAGKMLSFATSARGMIAGLTGIAGVAGLGMVAKRTIDSIDAMKKMGDRLGISTQNLYALKHAAELSGTSIEAIETGAEKLASAMREGLESSTSAAALAFKRLSLNIGDLQKLPIDVQLLKISDRLQRIRGYSERIDVVRSIFGRGGAELINLLAGGSGSLRSMMDEAVRLNTTLTGIDAAKVERAQDALTRVAATIQGHLRRAVVEVSPYIEAVANMLAEGIGGAKNAVPSLIASIKDLAISFGDLADQIINAIQAAQQYAPGRGGINWRIGAAEWMRFLGKPFLPGNRFEGWANSLEDAAMRLESDRVSGIRPNNRISRFINEVDTRAADIARKQAVSDLWESLRKMASFFKRSDIAEQASKAQQKVLDDLKRKAEEVRKSVNTPFQDFMDRFREVRDLMREGLITWDVYGKAVQEAHDKMKTEAVSGVGKGNMFAAAVDARSVEAYSTILRATSGSEKYSIESQQLGELRKQTQYLDKLLQEEFKARGKEFKL